MALAQSPEHNVNKHSPLLYSLFGLAGTGG